MDPETLGIMKLLIENLDDDGLAEFAMLIALEVNKRGKLTPKAAGADEYLRLLTQYQRPG